MNQFFLTIKQIVYRAIYRDADIYLLDDPLSAVDTHVGRHLFDKCINGYLKNKTCILVTHQLQYLKECNYVIILNNVCKYYTYINMHINLVIEQI